MDDNESTPAEILVFNTFRSRVRVGREGPENNVTVSCENMAITGIGNASTG